MSRRSAAFWRGRLQVLVAGNDKFVFHRVFPTNQFRHRYLVAVRLQLQATQHVGNLAAEFARMDGVAPEFAKGILQRLPLVLAQHGCHLGLATWHQHQKFRLLLQTELDRVIGRGVTGMQRGDDIDFFRQLR
jgi:hypothetical protein